MGKQCGTSEKFVNYFILELERMNSLGKYSVDDRIINLVLTNRNLWSGFSWIIIRIKRSNELAGAIKR